MEFEEILATCIERLEIGETIESCLALFPEEAAELAPLLQMAVNVRSMPAPMLSETGFRKGRHAVEEAAIINKEYALVSAPPDAAIVLLDETGARIPEPRQNGGSSRTTAQKRGFAWPTFAGTAVAAVLLIAVLAGLSQSPQILPGNALYTVKQLGEQGQGILMSALGSEADWYLTMADRRLRELQALQASGDPTTSDQMDWLLSEIDLAIAASEGLGEDEQAQLRADLYANLAVAKETLSISGPALTSLERTQNALYPVVQENAVAVAPTAIPDITIHQEESTAVAANDAATEDDVAIAEPVLEPVLESDGVVAATDVDQPTETADEALAMQSEAQPNVESTAPSGATDAAGAKPETGTTPQIEADATPTEPPEVALVAPSEEQSVESASTESSSTEAVVEAATTSVAESSDAESLETASSETESAGQPVDEPEPTQRVFQPTPTWTPIPQPTDEPEQPPESESPQQPALAAVPKVQAPDDLPSADEPPTAIAAAMALEASDEADAGSADAAVEVADSAESVTDTVESQIDADAGLQEPTATATNTITPTATLVEVATASPTIEATSIPDTEPTAELATATPKPAKPPILLPTATATPLPTKTVSSDDAGHSNDADDIEMPITTKQPFEPIGESNTTLEEPTASSTTMPKRTTQPAVTELPGTSATDSDAASDELPVELEPTPTAETAVDSEHEAIATVAPHAIATPLSPSVAPDKVMTDTVVPGADGEEPIMQPTAESSERPLQRLLERQPSVPPLLLPTPTSTP